jgi:diguanylate cyclase (GGDEF)-like protein/PAS domain S-box-containing protein
MLNVDKPIDLIDFLKINLCVGFGYFLLGYAGTLLASSGHASPVWPASGLALAAVLVYGRHILLGLFLGVLAIQVYSFIDFSILDYSIVPSLTTGLVSTIGSCSQAFFGAYLINYFLGKQDPLVEDSKIIYFFLLGSPIACLIASTLGSVALFSQGVISSNSFFRDWAIWWVGDSIGVIIFTPIILSFIAYPKSLWRERKKLVTYPQFLMLSLVVIIFHYANKWEEVRINSIFEDQVNTLHTSLKNETLYHIEINRILKGFFDSLQQVTKVEFSSLTWPIINKHESLQALEWISVVSITQRQQFESFNNLVIRELSSQQKMIPALERAEYLPITYVEPLEGNKRAVGFDITTNLVALKAVLRARDSGKTTITEPIQLVQDLVRKIGVVLYSPVYYKNKPLNTDDDRRRAIKGFAASVFRMEDELHEVFERIPNIQLVIDIKDQNKTLYSNFSNENFISNVSLEKIKQIQIADRIWSLVYQPAADFYSVQVSWTVWWVLLGSFLTTGLTTVGLLMLSGRTLRREELVRFRTKALATSEAQFRSLVQAQSAIVWRADPETFQFTFVSDEAERILGYPIKEWLENKDFWIKHLHKDDQASVLRLCMASKKPYEVEYRMLNKAGEVVCFRDVVNIITEHGKLKEMLGVMIDVTDRHRAEEEIKLNQSKYKTLFDNAIEAFIILDIENLHFIEANENALTLFGLDSQVIQNFTPLDISPRMQPNGISSIELAQKNIGRLFCEESIVFEWTHLNKAGSEIICEISLALLPSLGRRLAIASIRDITEQKKLEQEIYALAFYDPLTGLANRRLLLDQLKAEVSVAKRNKTFGAILFLDLDRFKLLNDSLGHHAGDQLLRQVSKRIKSVIRIEDMAARIGGDEFVILIRAYETSLKQASKNSAVIAEKIRSVLEQPYYVGYYEHHCSSSIGISLFPEKNSPTDELLKQADKAMYRSKEQGRNRVNFFRSRS